MYARIARGIWVTFLGVKGLLKKTLGQWPGLNQGDEVALEKPDDDMIGETITLTGETKTKEEKKIDPMVAKYDTDGDGTMSGAEWRAAMPKMTEDEKAKAMDKMRQRFGGGGRKPGGPGGGRGPRLARPR